MRPMFRAVRCFLAAVASIAVLAVVPVGCVAPDAAQIGPGQKNEYGSVQLRNNSPNTLVGVDKAGTYSINSVGPVSQTEISTYDLQGSGALAESISSRAGSSASHRAVIPIPGSTRSIVTDTQAGTIAKVGKLYDPGSGQLLMEGLELQVDPVGAIEAQNEAIREFTEQVRILSPEQKEGLVAQLETIKASYPSAESVLTTLIKAVLAVP